MVPNETIRTRQWRHDHVKLQCNDVVLYPFHDDVVIMILLIVLISRRHDKIVIV